jgi:hypothetical protein
MEFIVGFPLMARRHDSIFVLVDTLKKSAHFIPVRMMYHAPDVAKLFFREIVRLHGVQEGSYPIEDRCLQDGFGPVSNRIWEQN